MIYVKKNDEKQTIKGISNKGFVQKFISWQRDLLKYGFLRQNVLCFCSCHVMHYLYGVQLVICDLVFVCISVPTVIP